jgi:hypothetical protein
MNYSKRKQPLRIRNDSYKHWIVKSVFVFELEKMGHEVELELHIPGLGLCDLIDRTTWIQYEIDGNSSPKYRRTKARKYLRPGIRDVIVIPTYRLSDDIHEIRSYVRSFIVVD